MNVGEVCWNELATADVQKAKDFYTKMFGWQYNDIKSDVMTYTLVKSKDKEFAGIWQIPTEQQGMIPPHWMAYILVENAKTALENAKKYGATIVKDVTQAGDMGLFGILTDPTGAHIAVWQPLQQK